MKKILFVINVLIISCLPLAAQTNSLVESIVELLPAWSLSPYFTLTLWQWMGLGVAVFIGLLLGKLVNLIVKAVHKFAHTRSKTEWDDLIIESFVGPSGMLVASGAWYVSIAILDFNKKATHACVMLIQIIISIALIYLVYKLTNVLIKFLYSVTSKTESDLDDQLMPVVEKGLKFLVVAIGSLIALQNLGVNVVSAIAGLGIGGLAFALAAKDTAANMFGSLTIFLDQPFKMGDWVIINGKHEGIIEAIGIRTTRIRTFKKTEISLPNAMVANSSIENVSRRPYRRTSVKLGLTYDTAPDKVEAAVNKIREILDTHPIVVNELTHVYFTQYAASSLDILVFFFLDVPDWGAEMKHRQEVYLSIMKAFNEMGISFAFPSQSVYVETMPVK